MNTYVDWTKLYAKYKGLWVALADDGETVVGSGDTPERALDEAVSHGNAHAALTYVPTEVVAFAGSHEV